MKIRLLLFIGLLILFSDSALATTYYVATTGSNSNSCTAAQSISTPKLTMAAGLACSGAAGTSHPGDIVQVAAGVYTEQINDQIPSGVSGNPFTFKCATHSACELRQGTNYSNFQIEINSVASQWIVIDGFLQTGGAGSAVSGGSYGFHHDITWQFNEYSNTLKGEGLSITGCDRCKILNNSFHDIGTPGATGFGCLANGTCPAIYISNFSRSGTVDSNNIHNVWTAGYIFTDPGDEDSNFTFSNNTIHDNTGGQYAFGTYGAGHIFFNNIVYNNPQEGLLFRFNSGVKIYNNTTYNNGNNGGPGTGISVEEGGAVCQNNLSFENVSPIGGCDTSTNETTDTVANAGNYVVNPGTDFHLKANIAGANLFSSGVVFDYYGIPRNVWNEGAVERLSTSPNTRIAASCSQADVLTSLKASVDGDTVVIPAGTCSWTNVSVDMQGNAGITITGTGTPSSDPAIFVPSTNCNQTTLNINNATQAFSAKPTYVASTMRFSCMIVNASTQALGIDIQGVCLAAGCPNVRIDNITWNGFGSIPHNNCSLSINCITNVFGVADHNYITGNGDFLFFIDISHGIFPDYSNNAAPKGNNGDSSWANPPFYGTNRFFFEENNTFFTAGYGENESQGRWQLGSGDTIGGGGRIVVRFNRFLNMVGIARAFAFHGTEDRQRAPRTYEFYANYFECDQDGVSQCTGVAGTRDTTGLAWGNTIHVPMGALLSNFWDVQNLRTFSAQGPWGACDGSSSYDVNDGITYFSGLVSAWDGNQLLTVTKLDMSDPGFTPSQYASFGSPYSIHDSDGVSSDASGAMSTGQGNEIWDNTHNQLTLAQNQGHGWNPVAGHHVQIMRATVCLDMEGRGKGFYYTGTGTTPFSAFGATPYQSGAQILDPTYLWLNYFDAKTVCSGTCGYNAGNTERITSTRDFYQEDVNQSAQTTPLMPFSGFVVNGNGGLGLGHGTKARIPRVAGVDSCTPTVGYWATDEGSWNHSSNTYANGNSQGNLYLCNTTNAWTLSYTPFDYPHTLVNTLADTLNFTSQPTTTVSGSTFSPVVIVEAQTGCPGACVTDPSFTGNVTIVINSCGASNTGTTTVAAVAGKATFTAVGVTGTATGCMEMATAALANAANSSSFDVTGVGCVPDHVVFTSQPHNTNFGLSVGTVTVAVLNASGTTCTAATNLIVLSNHAGTCTGMTINGSTSGNADGVTGSYTTTGVFETSSSLPGNCALDANSTGLTLATSNTFVVSLAAGHATRIRVRSK